MRRNYAYPVLWILLLTVALAGCRQEPLPGAEDAIHFSVAPSVVAGLETKAGPTSASYLETNGIAVYGSYGNATQPTTVFDKTTPFTYVASTNTLSYTPLKYWRRGESYGFRAVSPAATTVTGNGYGINISNYNVENGYDLLVASASVASAPPANNTVGLTFIHAGAAVRFLFRDATVAENAANPGNYHITSFELRNVYAAGTLAYTGDSSTTPVTYGTGGEWSYSGARASSVCSWSGSYEVTAAYNPITGREWYYPIPQDLNVNDSKHAAIHFTYTVGDDTQELPATLSLEKFNGANVIWEPGMVYTYKIQIQTKAITFDVEWANWTETDNTPLIEPEPTY
jgi:hypothetical protein